VASENEFCKNQTSKDTITTIDSESYHSIGGHKHSLDQDTHALGEIQPKISRHLALLREAGVVLDRRQGQWIYYRINPDLPMWTRQVITATTEGIVTQAPFNEDLQSLRDMPNRPESACCA